MVLPAELHSFDISSLEELGFSTSTTYSIRSIPYFLLPVNILLFEFCKEKLGVDQLPGAERVNTLVQVFHLLLSNFVLNG